MTEPLIRHLSPLSSAWAPVVCQEFRLPNTRPRDTISVDNWVPRGPGKMQGSFMHHACCSRRGSTAEPTDLGTRWGSSTVPIVIVTKGEDRKTLVVCGRRLGCGFLVPGTLKETQNMPETREHGPPENDWVTEGLASLRQTGERPSLDLAPTFPGSFQGDP